MRRAWIWLLVPGALGAPSVARATAGTAFGESSRAAALASSVSARPGDSGTILLNPAGLGDLDQPELSISGQVGQIEQWFERRDEPKEERDRWFGGVGLAVATPLPGPDPLRRFRFGLALHMPAEHALRVTVRERTDEPTSPIYDGRPDRMSALAALAVAVNARLRLGLGLTMTPSLATPTDVSYDADRADKPEDQVMVRLERDLEMDVAPFFGLRAVPFDQLALALVYRDAAISRASGNQTTRAGGILADDPVDYAQFWDPAELVLGAMGKPIESVSLSFDGTYHRWSQFRSGFNRELEQPFSSVWSFRGGAEWRGTRWLAVRAGYAFEPTPIPEQTGNSNYLGADTHVLGLGGGVDLRPLVRAPLVIDAHARLRMGGTQHAEKRASELSDTDGYLPGKQIDNLGYPGFSSQDKLWQVGLTLTLFIGKEKPR